MKINFKAIKKIVLFFFIIWSLVLPLSIGLADTNLAGRILLQVEKNGEAWYWNPSDNHLYYLGRPADAFRIMREQALGISNSDFDNIKNDPPSQLLGRILLKTEDNGEAWYVNPVDRKLYYLGRPADAFQIMRELGLGVSEKDFQLINRGEYDGTDKKVDVAVPFTSQAPLGEWSIQRFQDACEEASVLMAAAWANDFDFTSNEARDMILALSEYAGDKLGEWRDQSVADTARLLDGFYGYKNYKIVEGNIDDMIGAVENGQVVIVPFNGQKLGNPFYTAPGPIHHMMLIHGYDRITQEFIVNDPGTRHGENYRYKKSVIDAAWRDYPTGYHEDFDHIVKKMIIVSK